MKELNMRSKMLAGRFCLFITATQHQSSQLMLLGDKRHLITQTVLWLCNGCAFHLALSCGTKWCSNSSWMDLPQFSHWPSGRWLLCRSVLKMKPSRWECEVCVPNNSQLWQTLSPIVLCSRLLRRQQRLPALGTPVGAEAWRLRQFDLIFWLVRPILGLNHTVFPTLKRCLLMLSSSARRSHMVFYTTCSCMAGNFCGRRGRE